MDDEPKCTLRMYFCVRLEVYEVYDVGDRAFEVAVVVEEHSQEQ